MTGNIRVVTSTGYRSCATKGCTGKIKKGELVLERYEIKFKLAFASHAPYQTTSRRSHCTACAKTIFKNILEEASKALTELGSK